MNLAERTATPTVDASRMFWSGALMAFENGRRDPVQQLIAVELGLRAAENEITEILQTRSHEFAATIGLRLERPAAHLYVYRDAVTEPQGVTFTEILDLLSKDDLPCVGPRLHRGWEDRRFACRRSRGVAQEAVGVTLEHEDREQLLLLSACRNRIFRDPPPVRIRTGAVLAGLEPLTRLVDRLTGA